MNLVHHNYVNKETSYSPTPVGTRGVNRIGPPYPHAHRKRRLK